MHPYAIEFAPAADRRFGKLPWDIQTRLTEKIEALANDPRPRGCIQLKGQRGVYRIVVGDYRVIYCVQDDVRRVVVTVVKHRKDAYR